MTSHEKDQLKTITIHIDAEDIYRTKNIDGLIKYTLKKQLEGVCGKYGYVVKDSVSVVKRSIGKVQTQNNVSKIEYDVTYKMKIIMPCKGDIYECNVESITKMGIIAFMKMKDEQLNTIKESPVLVIIPQDYIENDITDYVSGKEIDVEIMDKRIKYRAKQIQVVGKII